MVGLSELDNFFSMALLEIASSAVLDLCYPNWRTVRRPGVHLFYLFQPFRSSMNTGIIVCFTLGMVDLLFQANHPVDRFTWFSDLLEVSE